MIDLEKLTKHQIILITLLVSFVTSIATGIVTVALMDQAPPGVTQTINRVVERTIEKVITEPSQGNNAAAVATKETIIVTEDDKISEAVARNESKVVRIYTDVSDAGDVEGRTLIGLGTVVSANGLIATGEVFADQSGKYLATFDSTNFYRVKVLPKKENTKLYFLKFVIDRKYTVLPTVSPVVFGDSQMLKLGQSVIALGGVKDDTIAAGIVSSLSTAGSENASTTVQSFTAISTDARLTDNLTGSPLLNLDGEVIGLRVNPSLLGGHDFLSANILKQEIQIMEVI